MSLPYGDRPYRFIRVKDDGLSGIPPLLCYLFTGKGSIPLGGDVTVVGVGTLGVAVGPRCRELSPSVSSLRASIANAVHDVPTRSVLPPQSFTFAGLRLPT